MQYQYSPLRGALLDRGSSTETIDRLVEGLIDRDEQLMSGPSLAAQTAVADLGRRKIPQKLVELVPASVAWEDIVIPLESNGRQIICATANPHNIEVADKLRFMLNMDVRLLFAPKPEILAAIRRHYADTDSESVDSMLMEFTESTVDLDEYDEDVPPPARAYRVREQATRTGGPESKLFALRTAVPHRSRRGLGGGSGMFYYTVEEGQRVLMTELNGTMSLLVGPQRVWRGWRRFEAMDHHVAHPGEFLIIKHRDGHEEHTAGPADLWFEPRTHESIIKQECLQISAKEAVVAYRHDNGPEQRTTRRIIYGPSLFTPEPGEWLHTFSWHASHGGSHGVKKVPNGLVFQKLWLMPDQMYHDVPDVRTADDAVLTIRLMIFFELTDIELMLQNTHDPIGDFVNAATADVVEFTGRHDFESFKHNTDKLNDIATYKTLNARSGQSGYRIHNVVYRGYGAADSLQQMHNQAIEARTKLQLERATEEQAQALENFKLESQMSRADKRRVEQTAETRHLVELAREKADADLKIREQNQESQRRQRLADSQAKAESERILHAEQQAHYSQLKQLNVDLTAFLTQHRADNVIEVRGHGARPHLHLDNTPHGNGTHRNGDGPQP